MVYCSNLSSRMWDDDDFFLSWFDCAIISMCSALYLTLLQWTNPTSYYITFLIKGDNYLGFCHTSCDAGNRDPAMVLDNIKTFLDINRNEVCYQLSFLFFRLIHFILMFIFHLHYLFSLLLKSMRYHFRWITITLMETYEWDQTNKLNHVHNLVSEWISSITKQSTQQQIKNAINIRS